MDLCLILKEYPRLGQMVLEFFPKFLRRLPENILRVLERSHQNLATDDQKDQYREENFYCLPLITNSPLFTLPSLDAQRQIDVALKKNGILLHLTKIAILKVFQPEYFLYAQTYRPQCKCEEAYPRFRTNSFLKMLKHCGDDLRGSQTLAEGRSEKYVVCPICQKIYCEDKKSRKYLNCQKMVVYVQDFSRTFTIYTTNSLFLQPDLVRPSQQLFGLAYYDVALDVSGSDKGGRLFGRPREYMLALDLKPYQPVINRCYLTTVINSFQDFALSYQNQQQQQHLQSLFDPLNPEAVSSEFCCMRQAADKYFGDRLPEDVLAGYKLSVLLSLVFRNRDNLRPISRQACNRVRRPNLGSPKPQVAFQEKKGQKWSNNLHLCLVLENDSYFVDILKGIGRKLENFGVWPYCYDHDSLMQQLMRCNNGIILVPDAQRLTRRDLSLIERILKCEPIDLGKGVQVQLDATIWFCVETEPDRKRGKRDPRAKGSDICGIKPDYFGIIVNLCREHNEAQGISMQQFDQAFCNHTILNHLTGYQVFLADVRSRPWDGAAKKCPARQESLSQMPEPSKDPLAEHGSLTQASWQGASFFQSQLSYHQRLATTIHQSQLLCSQQPKSDLQALPVHQQSMALLERFFLRARAQFQMTVDQFTNILQIAMASSLARHFIYKKNLRCVMREDEVLIDGTDAFIAIMLAQTSATWVTPDIRTSFPKDALQFLIDLELSNPLQSESAEYNCEFIFRSIANFLSGPSVQPSQLTGELTQA